MSDRERQAICCTCGTVRTCKRARNHREENYWLSGPINRDWHRETGELKCSECGRITVHALLHPAGDWAVDHAEMMQRIATGNAHSRFSEAELVEVRSKFRKGLPRNPCLEHLWWQEDAKEAVDAGCSTFLALCGETLPIRMAEGGRDHRSRDDQQVRPEEVEGGEVEDSTTGHSWAEISCVDCLRVWHQELLRRRRKVLAEKLTVFLADMMKENSESPTVDLQTVNALINAVDDVQQARSKCQGVRQ